ncbi:hypothetical protein H6F90_12605 [Trichocoleus sp. FACHB-591]|uniref:hypothetical protein n=1 Tax=Trichocoleus sp. FACHB-591 TaxID=2692872 RepID=UPI0016859199|nr:hypothetical protein [Trichocoleus sp. FACHB-591]MBD2095987.1 hypothetical protein [Trichocoleus sp. FACHB-591]
MSLNQNSRYFSSHLHLTQVASPPPYTSMRSPIRSSTPLHKTSPIDIQCHVLTQVVTLRGEPRVAIYHREHPSAPSATSWHNLRIMVLLPHLVKRSPPKNATTTICFCAIPNASRRVTVA